MIRPTGEFPLNDDWQYAHVAKRLAESGRLEVDVRVAPSLALQSAAGAAVIRGFGFSHARLRALTVAVAAGMLLLLDRLLAMAGAGLGARLAQIGVLAFNPLVLDLTFSFMTEIYGAAVSLLGVWIWYRSLAAERAGRIGRGRWGRRLAALVVGLSFWARQFAVLAFPALALARLAAARRRGAHGAVRRELRTLAGETLVFALPIALYFAWASGGEQLNPLFTRPLGRALTRPTFDAMLAHAPVFVLYLTAFLAPWLIVVAAASWRDWLVTPRRCRQAATLVGALALAAVAAALFADELRTLHPYLQRHFPLLRNIVLPHGVGPVTLSTLPVLAGPPTAPDQPLGFWIAVEVVLVALGWSWLEIARRATRLGRSVLPGDGTRAPRRELVDFGVAFALLSFFATVQVYRFRVFDRYFFQSLLGATLAVVLLAPAPDAARSGAVRRRIAVAFGVGVWALSSGLSVAAVHDYFRWNEARWSLFARALGRGVPSAQIDGGYEINGWLEVEGDPPRTPSRRCGFRTLWFCRNLDYTIGLEPVAPAGDLDIVLRQPVADWLGNFPDLVLVRRSTTTGAAADAPAVAPAVDH